MFGAQHGPTHVHNICECAPTEGPDQRVPIADRGQVQYDCQAMKDP